MGGEKVEGDERVREREGQREGWRGGDSVQD